MESSSQGTALQAERRGNFVVIGCVEGSRVVSWSLNVSSTAFIPATQTLMIHALVLPNSSSASVPLISAHSTVNCTGRSRPLTQALNHAETVRLLASIELAAYACKQAMADPSLHSAIRRRIARVIKDDRRRRHKRRKDQDAMVAAFARTGLVDSGSGSNSNSNSNAAPSAYAPSFPSAASAPPPAEPVPVPAPVPMPIPEPAMHAAPGQAPEGLYMGMQPEL